jgi:hypothetical protein
MEWSEVKGSMRSMRFGLQLVVGAAAALLAISQTAGAGPNSTILTVADFNQDGVTDILAEQISGANKGLLRTILIDSATGEVMGNQFPIQLKDGYEFLAVGNFNGNLEGQSQIAARKMSVPGGTDPNEIGGVRLWDLTADAKTVVGAIEGELVFIPDPMYQLVGIGDLDGNGVDDFVFVHDNTGPAADQGLVRVYLMKSSPSHTLMEVDEIAHPLNVSDFAAYDLDIYGIADANGDGRADFIFASRGDGDLFPNLRILLMAAHDTDGVEVTDQKFAHDLPELEFDFLGFANIDPGPSADLLFTKTGPENQNIIQVRLLMDDAETLSSPFFPVNVGTEYQYVGNGLFDSDTETDFVLIRTSTPNEGLVRFVLLDTDSAGSVGEIDLDDQKEGQIKGHVFPALLDPTLWQERSSAPGPLGP